MSLLPRVTERARELLAREFDARGPDVCMAEIVEHLQRDNPEFLHMAAKCAADLGSPAKLLVGFGMFYRLLVGQLSNPGGVTTLGPLPRVSPDTRALLVAEIDEMGAEAFTREALAELEASNPELLQLANNFASELDDYLRAMQGFALLHRSLVLQSAAERTVLH
jgi:hypothetical protein